MMTGVQHIARLMGTYQSITEKQSFSVIMSNFCNGFGYSWNIFYSPLTAYVPLIFKLFNVSFIKCIKLFMFVVVLASGITMYFFTLEVTKNKKIALLSSLFYIFAPYRLTDMYARNALAELTSFVFIPMIFHGLYGILKQKEKKEILLILGAVGLILTHTVIAMYVAIICFVYVLTQLKKFKNKKIFLKLISSIIFIIIITSFFWAPLLEHKLKAEYEVFKPGRMERTDVLIAFKLNFYELFITPKENIMTYEIGWLSVTLLLFTPVVIKRLNKKFKKTDFYCFYIFSLISGLICITMTLKIFPFEDLPSILKMLQFSFRMLEFSSFFLAIVASINFAYLIKTVKYKDILVLMIILMLLTCSFIPHLHYADNVDESRLWPAVRVTSKTGRVHAGCASFEYLPCKAFENREYIENRTDDVIVLEGNATIYDKEKRGTNLKCKLLDSQEATLIEFPYIYYLGYNVTIEKEDKEINIKTIETKNGFLGCILPEIEDTTLKVSYKGTKIMNITNILSILGFIILIFKVYLFNYIKKSYKSRTIFKKKI